MKRIYTFASVIGASLIALVACNKEATIDVPQDNHLVKVTLVASNPSVNPSTKTEIDGTTPYWSVGDAIGVVKIGTNEKGETVYSNYKFTTDITERSLKASFNGSTEVSDALYAYYPYTTNGASASGAKVDIPAEQHPTATSFDGAADIMIAKPFSVDAATQTVSNLQFSRMTAVVKVILKDNSGKLVDAKVSEVSLSTVEENNLVGRAYVDVFNEKLGNIYYSGSNKVTAKYVAEDQYTVDGTNATFFSVYPVTFAKDSKLTVEATAGDYAISKIITLPQDIVLQSGKLTTLNISLSDNNIAVADKGHALPFTDNMDWADNGSADASAAIAINELPKFDDGEPKYSATDKTYKGIGGLKFSSSSVNGSLTTSKLDLSKPYTVSIEAKAWVNSKGVADASYFTIFVDGIEAAKSEQLTTESTEYTFALPAATDKSEIKFVSTKRSYLYNINVYEGSDVPMTMSADPTSFEMGAEGGEESSYLTFSNVPEGVTPEVTAKSSADWITVEYADEVGVDFTVAENTGALREGTITVSCEGVDDIVLNITQEGAVTMSVAEVIAAAKGDAIDLKNVYVGAVSTKGFVVTDGKNNILIYQNATPSVKIGDLVNVTGTKDIYYNFPQVSSPSVTVVSSDNNVPYPAIKDITSTFDSYAATEAEYVTYTATMFKSGKYTNFDVEGAEKNGGLSNAPDSMYEGYAEGDKVKIVGFYNNLNTSTGLQNVIAVSVTKID